jgi:hypothetical protein
VKRDDIRIAVNTFADRSHALPFTVPPADIEWEPSEDGLIGRYRLKTAAAPRVVAYLRYGPDYLDQTELHDQQLSHNPLLQFHKVVDPNGALRRELLSDKPKHFEELVALLFNLSGWQTLAYGKVPFFQDAPDIVAVASNDVLAIECTIGSALNAGKLARLAERARDLGSAARPSDVKTRSLPVLVMPRPRQLTIGQWREMQELGIALLCHEELALLLDEHDAPRTASDLFNLLTSWIPSVTIEDRGSWSSGITEL